MSASWAKYRTSQTGTTGLIQHRTVMGELVQTSHGNAGKSQRPVLSGSVLWMDKFHFAPSKTQWDTVVGWYLRWGSYHSRVSERRCDFWISRNHPYGPMIYPQRKRVAWDWRSSGLKPRDAWAAFQDLKAIRFGWTKSSCGFTG